MLFATRCEPKDKYNPGKQKSTAQTADLHSIASFGVFARGPCDRRRNDGIRLRLFNSLQMYLAELLFYKFRPSFKWTKTYECKRTLLLRVVYSRSISAATN